jgi:hypothetical protein
MRWVLKRYRLRAGGVEPVLDGLAGAFDAPVSPDAFCLMHHNLYN